MAAQETTSAALAADTTTFARERVQAGLSLLELARGTDSSEPGVPAERAAELSALLQAAARLLRAGLDALWSAPTAHPRDADLLEAVSITEHAQRDLFDRLDAPELPAAYVARIRTALGVAAGAAATFLAA